MTQGKKDTFLWFASGLFLSLLILLVVFRGLSGNIFITNPEGIPETANAVLTCIQTGSWDDMDKLISGNPVLDPSTGVAVSAEGILFQAFQESLQWTFEEEFKVQHAYITQRITITCLDIPETTNTMAQILNDGPTVEDPMYWAQIMAEAAEQVLKEGAPCINRELTLTLRRENGTWVVVPDQEFLHLLSGFTVS